MHPATKHSHPKFWARRHSEKVRGHTLNLYYLCPYLSSAPIPDLTHPHFLPQNGFPISATEIEQIWNLTLPSHLLPLPTRVLNQPGVQSIPILHVSPQLDSSTPPMQEPSTWALCFPALLPPIPPAGTSRGSHTFSGSHHKSNLSKLLSFLQQAFPNYTTSQAPLLSLNTDR